MLALPDPRDCSDGGVATSLWPTRATTGFCRCASASKLSWSSASCSRQVRCRAGIGPIRRRTSGFSGCNRPWDRAADRQAQRVANLTGLLAVSPSPISSRPRSAPPLRPVPNLSYNAAMRRRGIAATISAAACMVTRGASTKPWPRWHAALAAANIEWRPANRKTCASPGLSTTTVYTDTPRSA